MGHNKPGGGILIIPVYYKGIPVYYVMVFDARDARQGLVGCVLASIRTLQVEDYICMLYTVLCYWRLFLE